MAPLRSIYICCRRNRSCFNWTSSQQAFQGAEREVCQWEETSWYQWCEGHL